MVHILPQGNSKAVAKMYMAHMSYAYDVASKGMVSKSVSIPDLSAITIAESPVCPFPYGACVSGGGLVKGTDYLGQLVTDDTGTVAFYRVDECDEGATWSNQFGLPYAYAAGVGSGGITFTPPTDDGDHRGTFTAEPTAEGVTLALAYIPVAGNLHGDAYGASEAAAVLSITEPVDGATLDDAVYSISGSGAVADTEVQLWSGERTPGVDEPNAVTTADADGNFSFTGSTPAPGTVTWHVVNEGVSSATITVTAPEDDSGGGDAFTVTTTTNALNVTVSADGGMPEYVFDYGDGTTPDDGIYNNDSRNHAYTAAGDYTITVTDADAVVVTKTVTVADDVPADGGLTVPTRFNSHADSDAWLADNDLPTPDGWGSMTLTDKATLMHKLYGYSSDV